MTVTKICKECGELEVHTTRKNGTPFMWCMKCQREYSKRHYHENKDKHNKRRYRNKKNSITEMRMRIDEIKSVPCMDCGGSFPPFVMDFDHVPGRGDKEFNVSEGIHIGKTVEAVLAEIEKCDVICSNCHRIRTFTR